MAKGSPEHRVSHRHLDVGVSCAVFAATALTFAPVLSAQFTNWDDKANILDNDAFRGFSAAHFKWFWTTAHLGVFEPLSWMLKAAIWSVAGLSPRAFHGVSLLLHGLNAVMVYFIARRLLARVAQTTADIPGPPVSPPPFAQYAASALAALLFGLHPLRAEVVAWASGQSYVLAAFFALAATLCYLRSERRSIAWLATSWVLYVAALLSKTAAISLPLALLIIDWYPLRRVQRGTWWRAVARLAPFFVAAAIVATRTASLDTNSQIPAEQIGFVPRLLIAGFAPAFYLLKSLVPTNLSPMYALPLPFADLPPRFMIATVASVVITVIILLRARRNRGLVAAWLVSLAFIAPVSGIVRHGDQYAADRYTYLAQIGLAIAAAATIARRSSLPARRAAFAAAGVACAALAAASVVQARVWQSSFSLWTQALKSDPANWCALNNMANAYLDAGDAARAEEWARAALAAAPRHADAHFTRGCALVDLNRLPEAEAEFRRTLEIDRRHKAVSNLADALSKQGRDREAADLMVVRVKTGPFDYDILLNAGVFLAKAGRMKDAIQCMTLAAEREPTRPDAWLNLGLVRLALNDIVAGKEALRRCLQVDPQNEKAREVLQKVGG